MTVRSRQCDRARELVSLELDGGLSSFSGTLLRRHLSRCTECREYAEVVRGATTLLRAAPLEPWSASLPVARARRRLSARLPRVATVAAAAAVAAFAFVTGGTDNVVPRVGPAAAAASVGDLRAMRQTRRQTLTPPARPTNPRVRFPQID